MVEEGDGGRDGGRCVWGGGGVALDLGSRELECVEGHVVQQDDGEAREAAVLPPVRLEHEDELERAPRRVHRHQHVAAAAEW